MQSHCYYHPLLKRIWAKSLQSWFGRITTSYTLMPTNKLLIENSPLCSSFPSLLRSPFEQADDTIINATGNTAPTVYWGSTDVDDDPSSTFIHVLRSDSNAL
jgi:hypothetical protein